MAYCSVIAVCMQMYDVRRAQEWTQALTGWCDEQSGLVPYRGVCLVHRAQILQLRGAWSEAQALPRTRVRRLSPGAVGSAWYRLGEVERHRGRYAAAERAYQAAAATALRVQPGLSRLRAAQGTMARRSPGSNAPWPRIHSRRTVRCCSRPESKWRSSVATARPPGRRLPSWASSPARIRRTCKRLAAYSDGRGRIACGDPRRDPRAAAGVVAVAATRDAVRRRADPAPGRAGVPRAG
jgi:hypothetical protein